MRRLLARIPEAIAWRFERLRHFFYNSREVVFWAGEGKDAPWHPDLDKLAEIGRGIGLQARQASPADLELFSRYHARCGHPFKPRRIRKMLRRWQEDCSCYIALDAAGEIICYIWVAFRDLYVEDISRVFTVGPGDALLFDLETRSDRHGSMGFAAASCAALVEITQRGRDRIVAWSTPEQFEKFRRFHWWTGLGQLKPLHLERCTAICGLKFRKVTPLAEDYTFEFSSRTAK